jgi:Fe-S cluster assembly protein SufD
MSAVPGKNTSSATGRYQALFDAQFQGNDALTNLRRAALERFIALGFPTQRDEDWKYTNLRRLESRSFALADATPASVDSKRWIEGAGSRLVFVNGRHVPALASTLPHPPGVTVLTLGQWAANNPDEVAVFLSKEDSVDTAFDALNRAYFGDGVVIDIANDVSLDQPLYVVHQSLGASGTMNHPRIVLRAGRNSRVTLIEHYVGADDLESLTNAVVTLDLESGARVSHYRLQQESSRAFHIAAVHARLSANSHYTCHDVAFGAALGRTNITASLSGAGAEAHLSGLFAPNGSQHLDTFTLVDHVAPHTISSEDYRGIAGGRGRGVYRGKVIVRKDAQKIDSRQSSRNLLLSPTAEIDTRPELEIYADDVKCSHGATTGQIDANSLFYLRSRGLSESEARALLIRAFADSVLASMESKPVRDYLEQRLNERFAGTGANA